MKLADGTVPEQYKLIWAGKATSNNKTLSDYNIQLKVFFILLYCKLKLLPNTILHYG